MKIEALKNANITIYNIKAHIINCYTLTKSCNETEKLLNPQSN